jgi:zinc protease
MLYQSLVQSGKAIDAGRFPLPRRAGLYLTVYAYPNRRRWQPEDLKSEVDKVIGESPARHQACGSGEGHQQLSRVRHLGTRQHRGKVSQLAMGQVLARDPTMSSESGCHRDQEV